ncbi:hypothetical protein SASPL_107969 [Salvia splendens]|uniref:Uncharacterized protein n=1 Tax=Salvia splendens TaxID=180675 RepID=A0A8X9A5S9_SALSN|nr:uncharacterized protein LOC121796582 [Salvia splendens]KAG6429912.1 hypothetical protein SASPL_107969 [Salvia splendens]
MAATLSSFRLPTVATAAIPHPPKPDPSRRSNNWWAPILGWSAEPDYITNQNSDPAAESRRISADKSLFRGCFTEQKAKELRKKTIETTTFHDIMYHSAIASRLASDLSGRAEDR